MNYPAIVNSPLFRGLSYKAIQEILKTTPHHIHSYDKNEVIFYQMSPADRIGLVLGGMAQAQKTFPNGSLVNVTNRRPGDLFGPAAAFSTAHRYPCDVVAVQPSTIMIFYKADFLAMMQSDVVILENVVTAISTATAMFQERLELYSYHGIAQKAAFWLLMMERKTGQSLVPLPGSMTKWAKRLNVSRPSLHREIKKMEDRGLIEYNPPTIKIIDKETLQSLLSD